MSVAFSHQTATATRIAGGDPLARPRLLRDGTVVRMRLLEPGDGEELRAGFARLSAESRYRRFFSPLPRLPESMLRRLLAMDGWNHVAIVAETIPLYDEPPELLGVARFVRLADDPGAAEISVAVIDDLQGRGLGTLLIGSLARLARNRGLTKLVASVLVENQPMIRLIRALAPLAAERREQGILTYEVDLERAADA